MAGAGSTSMMRKAAQQRRYNTREPSLHRVPEIAEARQDDNVERDAAEVDDFARDAAPPRSRTRTKKTLELDPFPEDDDPRPVECVGRPPMPSTTPKSHFAVAEGQLGDVNNALSPSFISSRKPSFRNYLRRSGTDVSTITGFTYEQQPPPNEIDRGIDPTKGSFDLVIVSNSESRASGSRHSNSNSRGSRSRGSRSNSNSRGNSREGRRGRQRSGDHHYGRQNLQSARDAVSIAADCASVGYTVETCDTRKLTYWSSLSVRAALAVMQVSGSEVVAQRAADAVLEEGKKLRPTEDLRTLATAVSLVVMECGGDHRAAAAVAVAIMNEQKGRDRWQGDNNSQESRSSSAKYGSQLSGGGLKPVASEDTPNSELCETNSMESKRLRLEREEEKIANKNRALEEASRLNNERERALQERMRSLDVEQRRADGRAAERKKAAAEQKLRDRKEALREKEREIERRNKALEERTRAMLEAERERAEQWKEEQARATDRLKSFSSEADTVDVMTTASMRCERQHLEEKEAEMAARNKALEEVIRLNREREAEIKRRMGALDAATAAVADKTRQARIEQKKDGQRQKLQEKEEEIARMNQELEEAARLNFQQEKEIAERMAALDAATAALLDRADNVQHEIDRRTQGSEGGSQQHGSNGGGGTYSPASARSRGSSPRNQHGEFSVATGSRGYAPQGNEGSGRPGQKQEAEPRPPMEQSESTSIFDTLTCKLYSMLDMPCDSSLRTSRSTAAGGAAGDGVSKDPSKNTPDTNEATPVEEERHASVDATPPRTKDVVPCYSQREVPSYFRTPDDDEEDDPYRGPPRIRAPTMSALTDDQRTWASRHKVREEEDDEAPGPYDRISNRNGVGHAGHGAKQYSPRANVGSGDPNRSPGRFPDGVSQQARRKQQRSPVNQERNEALSQAVSQSGPAHVAGGRCDSPSKGGAVQPAPRPPRGPSPTAPPPNQNGASGSHGKASKKKMGLFGSRSKPVNLTRSPSPRFPKFSGRGTRR